MERSAGEHPLRRSVTVVFAVGGHRTQDGFQPGSLIDSAAVEGAVADFMGLVRTVGGHIGSVDYEIRVGIERTGQDQMIMQTVDNLGSLCGNLHPDVPVQSGRGNDRNRNRRQEIPARGANPHPDCVNQGGITDLRITAACPCDDCQS